MCQPSPLPPTAGHAAARRDQAAGVSVHEHGPDAGGHAGKRRASAGSARLHQWMPHCLLPQSTGISRERALPPAWLCGGCLANPAACIRSLALAPRRHRCSPRKQTCSTTHCLWSGALRYPCVAYGWSWSRACGLVPATSRLPLTATSPVVPPCFPASCCTPPVWRLAAPMPPSLLH